MRTVSSKISIPSIGQKGSNAFNTIGLEEVKGSVIAFPIAESQEKIEVFTTCPHTLFGVDLMVLSPEHPLGSSSDTSALKEEVRHYQKLTADKSDLERAELGQSQNRVFYRKLCAQSS